jgi:hypothetical protein
MRVDTLLVVHGLDDDLGSARSDYELSSRGALGLEFGNVARVEIGRRAMHERELLR